MRNFKMRVDKLFKYFISRFNAQTVRPSKTLTQRVSSHTRGRTPKRTNVSQTSSKNHRAKDSPAYQYGYQAGMGRGYQEIDTRLILAEKFLHVCQGSRHLIYRDIE